MPTHCRHLTINQLQIYTVPYIVNESVGLLSAVAVEDGRDERRSNTPITGRRTIMTGLSEAGIVHVSHGSFTWSCTESLPRPLHGHHCSAIQDPVARVVLGALPDNQSNADQWRSVAAY